MIFGKAFFWQNIKRIEDTSFQIKIILTDASVVL